MKIRVFFSTLLLVVLLGSLLPPLAAGLETMEADAGPSLDDLRGMYKKGLSTVGDYKAAVAGLAPASPWTILPGAAPEAVLLAEDFETWPPPGWTIVDNGGDCVWDSNTFYARPNYAGGDGQCADADSDACGDGTTMDTELRSPLIDLSGALPGTFLQFVGAYDDLGTDDYAEVLISPDGGATWNQALYWDEAHSPYGPGEGVVIDMTPYLGSTEVVISFHYFAPDWDWWFEVDQVRVQSPLPDLSGSTKEVWPAKAMPGDVLTYTVHISNTGEAPAWQAVMTDVIPAGTAYVTDSVDCSFGDCWYDAGDDAVYWHQGVPPARYFVTTEGSANLVREINLIRAGQFAPDTWGTITTWPVPGIADNMGIDYDAQNGVLYHSDLGSANIVVTDLNGNVLGSFTCAGTSGFNTGVTYVEGAEPPEVWVTDPASSATTRCEALLQPGAPAAPVPVALPDIEVASLRELNYLGPGPAAPGDFIEQFPVDWAINVVGLVYDPSRDWVRYAHESSGDAIFDVDWPEPHPLLGQCALSAANPGWPSSLDWRDGAGYDFLADTYFLPDYQGDLAIRDDNIVEVDAQCNILNAWETDGPDNDSYDGSEIDKIVDIAVVPNPPLPEEVVITFQVEVVDAPCGQPVVNEAVITDPEAPEVVTVQAETLVVAGLYSMQDFEAGDGGYTSVGADPWTWGPPPMGPAHSGANAWSTESPYAPDADYQLLSAPIDLTTAPPDLVLQWWQDIYIQDAAFDQAYVEITTDTVTYEILWQHTGGTYDSNGWEHRMADISSYAGEVVQLRFRMETDGSDQYDGWAIDDVAIHSNCAGPDITVDPPSLHSDQCPDEQMMFDLSICNAGDQLLEWGISEVPVDIPWLSADPITGVVPLDACQVVGVTFDATGLAPGDYDGDLAIASNDPDVPTTTLPISLTVFEPAAIITVTTVITDLAVAFDAEVTGTLPITYVWDFGDGYGDAIEDPIHTYDSVGCYTVTLGVTNQCGFDDTSFEVCIEVPSFYYYIYLPIVVKNN